MKEDVWEKDSKATGKGRLRSICIEEKKEGGVDKSVTVVGVSTMKD